MSAGNITRAVFGNDDQWFQHPHPERLLSYPELVQRYYPAANSADPPPGPELSKK
jgi:hypothetical protein